MPIKLTSAQRIALEAARDYGNPNAYACPSNPRGWTVHPWRASRFAMFDKMKARGLFSGEYGEYKITQAGLEALG